MAHTFNPISPTPRRTWTWMLKSMARLCHGCCRWNRLVPPGATHLYMWLGVVWGIWCYHCHLTPTECQPWMLYLAALGGYLISKKDFRPGGMALLEWRWSLKAIRDIPGAAQFVPGMDATRRIECRPPCAVSLFLLALSISYFERTLWRCGQMWPYGRMGSLGTRLLRDCNVMGDAAKTSHPVPSTWAQNAIFSVPNIHIIPSHQIYVAIDNPSLVPSVSCLTMSSYLWNHVRTADDISHT